VRGPNPTAQAMREFWAFLSASLSTDAERHRIYRWTVEPGQESAQRRRKRAAERVLARIKKLSEGTVAHIDLDAVRALNAAVARGTKL